MLTLYAVGLGPTNPVIPTGETGTAGITTPLLLYIAGRPVPALLPGLGCGFICSPGNYLISFVLPFDIPTGDQPVWIEIAGQRSNTVILIVGPPAAQPVVGYLQSMYDPKSRAMSPGMLAWVGGGGFRTDMAGATCTVSDSVWPLECQGITVLINGRQAALQAVTFNSIALQIPVELAPGNATMVVERRTGTQVLRSTPFSFTLDALSPSLATQTALPPYASAVIVNSGGTAAPSNPVVPGDMIFIQAVGLGPTVPPLVTGFSPVMPVFTALQPKLTLGGVACEEVLAQVLPGSVGVYRIQATVPKSVPTGDQPVILEIGGKRSQDGLMLPVSNQPVIAAVTNAASGLPGVVSGSWVTIYGRNLAPSRREWREEDIVYDWLPTSLDGVVVAVNDIPAVVSLVSPNQINAIAPDDLPVGPVAVTVQSSLGWQKAQTVVKPYSPGLFPLGVPPGTYLLALHTDWSYVARPGMLPPAYPSRAARPGETIVFYATGLGATNPAIFGRQRFSGVAPLVDPGRLTLQVSGRPARITFAGLVSNGLYQINAVVPQELPDGDHEVVAVMGGESSARGRMIPVQR
jgi:uncharacterized protein (TIGR03437 family)